jgi:Zn-dependent peptidase ImmA (M78 family)
MARFIPDPVSGLPWRPYKSEDEIDVECEAILREFLDVPPGTAIPPPLSTDLLTTMIEEYAERLDLYADMRAEVEGFTIISATARPFVRINRRLSTASHRTNRLRSTLAHEFYHLVFHAPYYQEQFRQGQLFNYAKEQFACTRSTILNPQRVDWREWQAAYGAGALLMPRTALQQAIREHSDMHGFPPYTGQSQKAHALVELVACRFKVSREAAEVRLRQKGFLHAEAEGQQLALFSR